MSDVPSEDEIFEMEKNLIRELAADDELDREMLAILEEDELEASQSSSRNVRRRKYRDREREKGHDRLVCDYFTENPTFGAEIFRRRFRMRRNLFLRIVSNLENHSDYFKLRRDATGRKGLSPLQKCTAAIRQLAYSTPADSLDEYIRMGEKTALDCLLNFCSSIVSVFGAQYLRRPTAADTQRLLQMHEQRHGFPGMLGSLDCMHWEWRNCPVAWKGQYTRGDYGVPTIILEAVASADLWIWHAFLGCAGSNNDINVLNGSPLFNAVLQGNAPQVTFTVNGTTYRNRYYLTDGIYPEWASFVKSFPCPMDPKRKKFKERQEAARKDVERAFGVLQARWAIVRCPARSYYKEDLRNIIYTCIMLHNMIIEDEGDASIMWSDEDTPPSATINLGSTQQFLAYLQNYKELRDKDAHHQLRADLVEHIWANYGSD